jgi:hypothetical protein
VTVGYGDITPYSVEEKVLCILLMLIGIVSFSFATGTLASLIASIDSQEASLKEKMSVLNDIQEDYEIDHDLFNKLAKTIRYDHTKKKRDIL